MTLPHSVKDYEEKAAMSAELSVQSGSSTQLPNAPLWRIAQALFCIARELKAARQDPTQPGGPR